MSSSVDRHTVDTMRGRVEAAIWGPGGIAELLPDEEYQMLVDTEIRVYDQPSKNDLALVASEVGKDGHLLGLFTHPPSKIQLFASSIVAVGYDPVDVATHELGHRFNYDHSVTRAAVSMVGHSDGNKEARVLVATDDCPVCLLHSKTADIEKLMDGLRKRSHLQHRIPLGLGGTIPLAHQRTSEARSNLALIAPMMPNRSKEIDQLDTMLAELQQRFSVTMTPEDVSAAHALAYRAWDRAYDLNHVYWLNALYGSAMMASLSAHEDAAHTH